MTDEQEDLPIERGALPRIEIPQDIDPNLAQLIEATGLKPVIQYVQDDSGNRVTIQIINLIVNIGDLRMAGNEYNFTNSQIGAAGENARAEGFTQNQMVHQPVDLLVLDTELGQALEVARTRATEPDQKAATIYLESAKEEAKKGNESKALGYLKSAGKWALDIAEDIGTKLLAETIKSQMGA